MAKKRNTIETKALLISWAKFSRDILFSGLQREKFKPVTILAPYESKGLLSDLRYKYREEVDSLTDRCLLIERFDERDMLLSQTDPLLVALYFDRIQMATMHLEEIALKVHRLNFDEDLHMFFLGVVRGLLTIEPYFPNS